MTTKPTYEELQKRVKLLEKESYKYKQVEKVLREEKELAASFIENAPTFFVAIDLHGKTMMMNQHMLKTLGYMADEVIGKDYLSNLVPERDRDTLVSVFNKLTAEHKHTLNENHVVSKEGEEFLVEWHGTPVFNTSEEFQYFYGIGINITDRKQAEETLRESEEKFRSFSEQSLVGIYLIQDSVFKYVNPKFAEIFGYTVEQCLNIMPFDKLVSPDSRATVEEQIRRRVSGEVKSINYTFKGLKENGEIIDVEIFGSSTILNGKLAAAGTILDITDRKRTEVALQESEQKYLSLLEANPDPVVVYDMEGKVIYFNPAFTRVFGWSLKERIGQKMDDFVPEENWPETRMMIKRVTESEQRFSGLETYRYTKEGNSIPVSISGSFYADREGNMAGSVINLRDVSERKKLEAQFQQTQKMEAIGTLAGGIAHDFNNILSAIMGFTEISLEHVEKGTNLHSNLQEVFRAGKRAKSLVKHILTFSRQTEKEHKPVQLKLIAKEALKFLRSSLPTTIDIRADIQSNSLVLGDPTQVHQILMNLCTNAGHAMLKNGGVLDVKLEDVELEVDFTAAHPELKPGAYINLAVGDTGCGMPSQVLDRIFDPFFTTKKTGEGTGLGLSVVHGIVGSYGGAITVHSEPGQGSTFNVYLPIIEMGKEPEIRAEEPIPTGSECILFIDDEPALANLGQRILESLGYEVVIRNSSIEALELFKAKPDRFDLVITDMTMPHMTGDDLAGKLILIKPEIPVILCTGYSAKINEQQAKAMGIRAFVLKPFVKREIATKVREVLDRRWY